MRAVKDLGLKCPRDVSVIGFDELDAYELIYSTANDSCSALLRSGHAGYGNVAAGDQGSATKS